MLQPWSRFLKFPHLVLKDNLISSHPSNWKVRRVLTPNSRGSSIKQYMDTFGNDFLRISPQEFVTTTSDHGVNRIHGLGH